MVCLLIAEALVGLSAVSILLSYCSIFTTFFYYCGYYSSELLSALLHFHIIKYESGPTVVGSILIGLFSALMIPWEKVYAV